VLGAAAAYTYTQIHIHTHPYTHISGVYPNTPLNIPLVFPFILSVGRRPGGIRVLGAAAATRDRGIG